MSEKYLGMVDSIAPHPCAHVLCMEDAEKSYHYMQECGCKPEDARKVLPNSTATRIVMKANLREWRTIFSLRTSKAAYPEMRELMTLL